MLWVHVHGLSPNGYVHTVASVVCVQVIHWYSLMSVFQSSSACGLIPQFTLGYPRVCTVLHYELKPWRRT